MNLITDIGNTRTKFFLFEKGEIHTQESFFNEKNNSISQFVAANHFEKAIISSTSLLPDFVDERFLILNNTTLLPIDIAYKTPKTLGADRIALAVGADFIYPDKNVLAIDMGTCITFDFIDSQNVYHGGAISPGMTIRLQSLHTFTEKLPLVEQNDESNYPLIGKTTEESIESGVFNGVIAEIDGIIDRYKAIYQDLTVIITGGDHNFFALHTKNEIFAHANLQALGLNRILDYNAKT